MATKKSTPAKSTEKSKLLKVAEKVGTIAGTIVGKKNQLVKKAETVIETAKEKVHELTSKKADVKKAAKATTKKAVSKVTKKAAEVKKVARKAASPAKARATKKK